MLQHVIKHFGNILYLIKDHSLSIEPVLCFYVFVHMHIAFFLRLYILGFQKAPPVHPNLKKGLGVYCTISSNKQKQKITNKKWIMIWCIMNLVDFLYTLKGNCVKCSMLVVH